MVLHVTFSDGSNPWLSLPTDRHTIAKQWRKWMKYHPDTAQPDAICGAYHCRPENGGFVIYRRYYSEKFPEYGKHYKHLGHALAALERLGGEKH